MWRLWNWGGVVLVGWYDMVEILLVGCGKGVGNGGGIGGLKH